jgi:hypothetical protein
MVRLSLLIALTALALPTLAQEEKKVMPVEEMVQAILEQPILAENSFYYDNGFRAVGSFAVHNHFAKRTCQRRF